MPIFLFSCCCQSVVASCCWVYHKGIKVKIKVRILHHFCTCLKKFWAVNKGYDITIYCLIIESLLLYNLLLSSNSLWHYFPSWEHFELVIVLSDQKERELASSNFQYTSYWVWAILKPCYDSNLKRGVCKNLRIHIRYSCPKIVVSLGPLSENYN